MKFPFKPFLYLTLFCVTPVLFLGYLSHEKYKRHYYADQRLALEQLLTGCATGLAFFADVDSAQQLSGEQDRQIAAYLRHVGRTYATALFLVDKTGTLIGASEDGETTQQSLIVERIVGELQGAKGTWPWRNKQLITDQWLAVDKVIFQGEYYLVGIEDIEVLERALKQQLFPLLLLTIAGTIATLGGGCLFFAFYTAQKNVLTSFLKMLSSSTAESHEIPRHLFEDVAKDVATLTRQSKECSERLKVLTITDELTNTLDRDHILQKLHEEQAKMQRYATALSVVLIDIDGLTAINEQYGVEAGNDVLSRFAAILNNSLRSHDYVGRIGGDDFLLILPLVENRYAIKVAERIRAAVEVTYWGIAEVQLTMSGVVMQLDATAQTGEDQHVIFSTLYDRLAAIQKKGGNSVE